MAEGQLPGNKGWTLVWSPESAATLEEMKTGAAQHCRKIIAQLASLQTMCQDMAPGELEQALKRRFDYQSLRDEAKLENLFQIAVGVKKDYRVALLRIDPLRQILVVHLYPKNKQTKGITRATALAREREDLE